MNRSMLIVRKRVRWGLCPATGGGCESLLARSKKCSNSFPDAAASSRLHSSRSGWRIHSITNTVPSSSTCVVVSQSSSLRLSYYSPGQQHHRGHRHSEVIGRTFMASSSVASFADNDYPRHHHQQHRDQQQQSFESTNNNENSSISDNNNNNNNNNNNVTHHQKQLLQYTNSILPPYSKDPIGTLSYNQIIQISNCIDQWIASGEHRYLGAEQAERLMRRLIVERGGGRGLLSEEERGRIVIAGQPEGAQTEYYNKDQSGGKGIVLRKNPDVSWDMYHMHSVIHYLNELYSGKEFVDRILAIVATLEEEYVNDDAAAENNNQYEHQHDDHQYLEIPYKRIIALLCDHRTPHATAAAERILHNFESRLAQRQQQDLPCSNNNSSSNHDDNSNHFYHSNRPGIETYNNVLSTWKKTSASARLNDNAKDGRKGVVISYPEGCEMDYRYHPNPCSNLASRMLHLYRNSSSSYESSSSSSFSTTTNHRSNEEGGDGMSSSGSGTVEVGSTNNHHDRRLRPDFMTFNTAISSLANEQIENSYGFASARQRRNNNYNNGAGGAGGADYYHTIGKTCYEHLMSMLELHSEGYSECAPDLITFSTVLNTLGRGKHEGDEARAMEILDTMLRLSGVLVNDNFVCGDPLIEFDVVPRNKHFNIVLSLIANNRSLHENMFRRAKWYVDIMEQLGKKEKEGGGGRNHSSGLPTQHQTSDNLPIMDYAFGTEEEKAEDSPSSTLSAPDIITYNTLISIAAKARKATEAEQILKDLMRKSANGESEVKPDKISFNTVLMACINSKGPKKRIDRILAQMHEMAEKGDSNVRPDRATMTTVMNALTSAAKYRSDSHIQAERIVERMEANKDLELRPDTVTYTSLIKCWNESGHSRAAHRAEEIIHLLHSRYDEGHIECKPDTMLYNVAMNAIAKSDSPRSAQRVEKLLSRMQDRYFAGDADLTPTTQSLATVIQAWAKSNDPKAPMKAEKVLKTMHEMEDSGVGNVHPNTIAYTTCIMAWRNSERNDAGEHVDALLDKMEQSERRREVNMKPNAITYTNAMEAWINSRQPNSLEKVEAILERMIKRFEEGEFDSAPTSTTFNVVMKAIQHSSYPMKHEKAEQLLNRMKEMHENGHRKLKPTTITYNTFILACAKTEGSAETRKKAFSSVINALKELQDRTHLRTDLYTWPAVWSACQELLDIKEDIAWINHVFGLTIRSGFVNEYLFNNLRRYLPPKYLQKKINTTVNVEELTVRDLPREWSSNIKLSRRRNNTKTMRAAN